MPGNVRHALLRRPAHLWVVLAFASAARKVRVSRPESHSRETNTRHPSPDLCGSFSPRCVRRGPAVDMDLIAARHLCFVQGLVGAVEQ